MFKSQLSEFFCGLQILNRQMTDKKEELKATYLKDVEASASKSKFGFFNVPPPVSAGDTVFEQKTICKDDNGRVKTEQRNIFSGLCATGVLKKSMFQYTPSYTKGDVYQDPGKADRVRNLEISKKFQDKQTFRPASMNKTSINAAYEYVPQKQQKKDAKQFRSPEDGKVITESTNITSSPSSKIQQKCFNGYKHVTEDYENAKKVRRQEIFNEIAKRGQAPFKLSTSEKPYFSTVKEQFGEVSVNKKAPKQTKLNISEHDSQFKPSNRSSNSDFSYPEYMPIGKGKEEVKRIDKDAGDKKEPFRLMKKNKDSRPSPSISLSKMNIMRSMR